MRARTVLPAALAAALLALTGCGADSGADDETAGVNPSCSSQPPASSDAGSDGTTGPVVPQALRFTATTVDGKPFQADALAGKPTVLWFWAPWCPKCKAPGHVGRESRRRLRGQGQRRRCGGPGQE